MTYTTVYDHTGTALGWWLSELPILVLAVLFVTLSVVYLRRARKGPLRTKVLLLAVIVMLCLSATLSGAYRYYFRRHISTYYGSYQTIEGAVKNYKVVDTRGGVIEEFDVEGVRFGYLDMYQTKCFHKSASNGGPMREGLPVRIAYSVPHYSTCIVKLEVAKESP